MSHELEQSQIIGVADKPKRTIAQNTLSRIEQTYAKAKPDSLRLRVLKHYVNYLDAYSDYHALPDSATDEELNQGNQKVRAVESDIELQDDQYKARYNKTDKMAEKLIDAYVREGATRPEAFRKTVEQYSRH